MCNQTLLSFNSATGNIRFRRMLKIHRFNKNIFSRWRTQQLSFISHIPKCGLLSDVEDIPNAKFYSQRMSITDACALLDDTKYIYNIFVEESVRNELIDLKNIKNAANKFINSNKLWDREEPLSFLEDIIESKGQFICVLAGKNTGKSIILRDLETRFREKVFIVNMRMNRHFRKFNDCFTRSPEPFPGAQKGCQ